MREKRLIGGNKENFIQQKVEVDIVRVLKKLG